jgi:hypothetical protein
MVKHLLIIVTLWLATPLLAQSAPEKQSGAASSPAKSIGMYAYPKNQQSADQQLKDENGCFASAKQQSGIDPQAPAPATKTEEQKKAEQQAAADNAKQAKGGRVKGAARGAAGGAAIGAIADDEAGKGASAGAAAGTMAGGAKQRRANKASKSKRRRPLPNTNNSRKPKQRPRTKRVSTHSSDPSLRVWKLADTRLSDKSRFRSRLTRCIQ